MSENEQRCGLCRWWVESEKKRTGSIKVGVCNWVIGRPLPIVCSPFRHAMEHDGAGCPTFQRKEPPA